MPLMNNLVRQRMQPLTAALTSNRIMLYGIVSTIAMLAAVANACRSHSNFYSITVYLSRSGRSLLILANYGLLLALVSGRVMQRIFFGPLQPREVERLYDQTWMFVTESLLAFTIFRDEFDIPFVLMFGFLLFVKCFHWLLADRVESMDQVPYPGPSVLFHVRMNVLFLLMSIIDVTMFTFAVDSTLLNGVGGMVLFATEYAILIASIMNSMSRYTLTNLEYRRAASRGGENAPPWENKSMYVFYIELVTDFVKLATYLTFFLVILTYYGLPLNIIRDVYLTARSFITRLRALIRYHNATRDMDRRYPNATEEELNAMSDRTCIICREELASPVNNEVVDGQAPAQGQDGPNMNPKKLPCGHIFHFQCLRSWLERQQSCPTCRRPVLEATPQRPNAQPGQQQANGNGPPAPMPGAAPQPGQPGRPLPGGFFGGWLARMFGLAVQPPLVPGQFPNGFVPPQGFAPPPPPTPGFVPPTPGFAQPPPTPGVPAPPLTAGLPVNQPFQHGQYYPYQPYGYLPQQYPPYNMGPPPGYPGNPIVYGVVPPPMYPQMPPHAQVLRGFYGPGGQYYAWPYEQLLGMNRGQEQQTPQPPGVTASPTSQGSVPAITSQPQPTPTQPVPTPTTTSSANSPTTSPSEPTASQATSTAGDDSRSARAAAAEAALRRLGALSRPIGSGPEGRSTGVEVGGAPRTSSGSEAATTESTLSSSDAHAAPTPVATSLSASQTRPTPASISSPATASSSAASSTSAIPSPAQPAPRQDVPNLIPLFDFNRQPPYTSSRSPTVSRLQQPSSPTRPGQTPHSPQGTLHQFRPGLYGTFGGLGGNFGVGSSPGSGSRTPLSRLPQTLTDEQLGRLDRVTREAIDERLRVLENVSGAVYRCVEELVRVRSALPPAVTSVATPAHVNVAATAAATAVNEPLPALADPLPPPSRDQEAVAEAQPQAPVASTSTIRRPPRPTCVDASDSSDSDDSVDSFDPDDRSYYPPKVEGPLNDLV
ncbi:hypothetical protein C8Q75DRAFT_865544 [Abortiporus biennis]|nr:hypothetical protein C8Q75DRAFT_865544 [Abortiporus biennis]